MNSSFRRTNGSGSAVTLPLGRSLGARGTKTANAYGPYLRNGLLLVTDALMLTAAAAIADIVVQSRMIPLVGPETMLWTVMTMALYVVLGMYKSYPVRPIEEMRAVAISGSASLAIMVAAIVTFQPVRPSIWMVLVVSLLAMVLVPLGRGVARKAFGSKAWWSLPVVILGAGKTAREVIEMLQGMPELGLRPVVALDDEESRHSPIHGVPVVGKLDMAPLCALKMGIRSAIVTMPDSASGSVTDIVGRHASYFRNVILIPDLLGCSSLFVSARNINGILGLEVSHRLLSKWRMGIKRLVDLVLTVVLLVLALPLIALIGIAIKLDSPGPVFFVQRRLGRDGRCFNLFKFRSMHQDAESMLQSVLDNDPEAREEYAKYHKLRNDPRVTAMGRFLRRSSLDELPQLFNVMNGTMSLVGPRAYLPSELYKMNGRRAILKARPGITGLWQVMGRNNVSFDMRTEMDVSYIRNWCIYLDLYLMAKTIPAVLFARGSA